MKQLMLVLVLAIFMVSCEKSVLAPKESPGWIMEVSVQEGEDSALAGSAVFCYPTDWKKIHDTSITDFNNYPDTSDKDEYRYYDTTVDHHGGTYFWSKKYVYDNKYFTFAGVDVIWIGPIYHRRYFTILKIKRIYQKPI